MLISTGVSKRKKKTDAFDDFGCTKQGDLLNVTIFKMLKRWRYIYMKYKLFVGQSQPNVNAIHSHRTKK